MKLHRVTGAGDTQSRGKDAQTSGNQPIGALLREKLNVNLLVQEFSLCGPQIVRPGLLDMNEGPLPAAEGEMLETGQQKKLLFRIGHQSICRQVTPSGRASSATVTI